MKNVYRSDFLVFTWIVFLISNDTIAQTNFWEQTNGPYGGYVTSLIVDTGHVVIAGLLYGGIYYSSNDGETWNKTNLTDIEIRCMARNSKGICFAGTNTPIGMYRSTDGGRNWMRSGLDSLRARSLIVGENDYVYMGASDGSINRSTDDGNTWSQINYGLDTVSAFALALNKVGHIYAGTSLYGLFKSTDQGKSWIQFKSSTGIQLIKCIAITAEDHIFLGTWNYGIYRSTDEGISWEQINSGLNSLQVQPIIVDNRGHLYAGTLNSYGGPNTSGVYKSTDNGNTWQHFDNEFKNIDAFALALSSNGILYAGTAAGVFRSSDEGENWTRNYSGLIGSDINSIAIDNNGVIYAGTEGGCIFKSIDRGMNWRHLRSGARVGHMEVNSNGYVFATLDSTFNGNQSSLIRSTDHGESWSEINFNTYLENFVINSSDHIFLFVPRVGIMLSTDDGDSWISTGASQFNAVLALALNSQGHIYAVVGDDSLLVSTNEGSSWNGVGMILPGVTTSLQLNSNNHIFINRYSNVSRLYRSTDNGKNWVPMGQNLQLSEVNTIFINLLDNIFIGTNTRGAFISSDNGDIWKDINTGLDKKNVRCFSTDPDGFIYAGTWGGGVYRSVRSTTPVKEISNITPASISLDQIYPNPFNRKSTIHFSLPSSGNVTLKIYDVLGKEIETLVNDVRDAGKYSVNWNAQNKPSGMYLCHLTINNMSVTKTIMLMK